MKFAYGRQESNYVKGIAIILMFYHHLFGFPFWIKSENMYRSLTIGGLNVQLVIAAFCELCVGLYAFTTSYAMHVQREKYRSWKGRLSAALHFLFKYWFVFLIFLILGALLGEPLPDWQTLLRQCFGYRTATGYHWAYNTSIHPVFGWYVSFYLLFLTLHPLLRRLSRWNFRADTVVCMAVLHGVYFALKAQRLVDISADVLSICKHFAVWGGVGMTGYLFAKYDIFSRMDAAVKKRVSSDRIVPLCALVLLAVFIVRSVHTALFWYSTALDALYVPVIIYGAVTIIYNLKSKVPGEVLQKLSKQSLYMWFLHGIFFTPRATVQFIAYFPQYPALILAWTLALTYFAAAGVQRLEDRLDKGLRAGGKHLERVK